MQKKKKNNEKVQMHSKIKSVRVKFQYTQTIKMLNKPTNIQALL